MEQLVLLFALVLTAMLCQVSHVQPAPQPAPLDGGAGADPLSRNSR